MNTIKKNIEKIVLGIGVIAIAAFLGMSLTFLRLAATFETPQNIYNLFAAGWFITFTAKQLSKTFMEFIDLYDFKKINKQNIK